MNDKEKLKKIELLLKEFKIFASELNESSLKTTRCEAWGINRVADEVNEILKNK
jgi:hypothetical protein